MKTKKQLIYTKEAAKQFLKLRIAEVEDNFYQQRVHDPEVPYLDSLRFTKTSDCYIFHDGGGEMLIDYEAFDWAQTEAIKRGVAFLIYTPALY